MTIRQGQFKNAGSRSHRRLRFLESTMTVRSGNGIKAAFLIAAMETDPSPPQAPTATRQASAAESEDRDLLAESTPPVVEGPERRLVADLRQTQPTRGQAVPTDHRKPAASRRSDAPPVAITEAGTALETADPVFQKALEILRREIPPPGQVQSPKSEAHSPESAIQAPGSEGTAPLPVPQSELRTQIIPARMLNEFVYCPRLFYYEFVESVFVESGDTLRGKALHRRVDSGKGDLPPAAEQKSEGKGRKAEDGVTPVTAPAIPGPQPATDEVIHSRSVQMGSDRLGVTAKMDLVEVRAGKVSGEPGEAGDLLSALEVCPVDYKAGTPKAGEDGNELWDADRMQLGVQALILRDNGYTCNEGVIYYRETKQRVPLPITPELALWVEERIAAARQAAAADIPPPLVASPKCPRCSLRAQLSAAPLKLDPAGLGDHSQLLTPRSIERGPVEARMENSAV